MATIHNSRYFLGTEGSSAVSTTADDAQYPVFTVRVQMPREVVFEGTANEVMDSLSALADHFAAAREAVLVRITG